MTSLTRPFAFACLLMGLTAACSQSAPQHPWIDLGPGTPHRILEFSGTGAGQVVIAMEPTVTREEALALGERIRDQAPPDATVNVRLYNDEGTARNWRTSASEMRIAHLLVVVSTNASTGQPEVRWVRPDSLDASASDETAGEMPATTTAPSDTGETVQPDTLASPDA